MEGLGIGFMEFLDEIDEKVKVKIDKNKKYEVKNYDFNDDKKEVLIDIDLIIPKNDNDSDQSGFDEMDED